MHTTSSEFIRYVILLTMVPEKELSEELIRAESYEEAISIAEDDPFVKSGAETYELRTWELSCEENNHMGMC